MNKKPELLQEELDKEYLWMEGRKKHSYNHKMINRKMVWRKIVFIALIVFIIISVLAFIFVLVFEKYHEKEDISKPGVYEIRADLDEGCYITYDQTSGNQYNRLLASGRSNSVNRGNGKVTSLLAPAAASSQYDNVFAEFVKLVNSSITKKTIVGDSVGNQFGVQYFDAEDKSYISFYSSYYVNRFYVINSTDQDTQYKLTINFVKQENYEVYKASRLILAIHEQSADEDIIEYLAFAVEGSDENNQEFVAVKQRDATATQSKSVEFLTDPNKAEPGTTNSVPIKYNIATGTYGCDDQELIDKKAWVPYYLKYAGSYDDGKDVYAFTTTDAKPLKANSNLEITLLFIVAEESDYDFDAETMSRNDIGMYISFDKLG